MKKKKIMITPIFYYYFFLSFTRRKKKKMNSKCSKCGLFGHIYPKELLTCARNCSMEWFSAWLDSMLRFRDRKIQKEARARYHKPLLNKY